MPRNTTLPTLRTYTQRGTTVVSRTAYDAPTGVIFFEITAFRIDRVNPTYQGTIVLRDGHWVAEGATPTHHILIGVFDDFVDAENALVARRTGITSTQKWHGPRPRRCEECGLAYVGDLCPEPSCYICGHHLYGAECSRPDLHWTPESLAEQDVRRRTRDIIRAAARDAALARADRNLNLLTATA